MAELSLNSLKSSKADTSHTHGWNTIVSTPTTLTAYGISVNDSLFPSVPSISKLTNQIWTEKCVLINAIDGYVSPLLPLTRNGTMTSMDFYIQGTPTASTTITVKQGATTIGSIALSGAGKATLTFSSAINGTADDLFTYTISGAGLAACVITCNQKWVNR